MDIEKVLKDFIVEELSPGERTQQLQVDDPLLESGIIDSLALIRLVAFLEDTMSLTIGDGDLVPENFQSINQIKAFVLKKTTPA